MATHSTCLENAMDTGAWKKTFQRVTKSWIRLKWLSTNSWSHYGVTSVASVLAPGTGPLRGVGGGAAQCWVHAAGTLGSDPDTSWTSPLCPDSGAKTPALGQDGGEPPPPTFPVV